ncbi:SH3 domain-containing protein [Streptomyces sp. NPDC088116]|uniref:SH3 domain-containing protein n=1 Tax=Streptomyces sp. NPDC088116 TaxID=3365825 RepID=UPI0037F2B5C0
MYTSRIKRRATAALAVLVIAGSGLLTANSAGAAGTSAAVASAVAKAPQPEDSVALPKGKVVSRIALHIRERPTSDSPSPGLLPPGTIVALRCKVVGQDVGGNDLWYRLGGGRTGYVAARFVENLSPVSYCRN